jgi:hypothetical protein
MKLNSHAESEVGNIVLAKETDLQALYALIQLLDRCGTQQQALNALILEAPCNGKLRHCAAKLVCQL